MNFLVLGCNGMAGSTISLYLHEAGHSVLGFDLQKSKIIESVSGDATDNKFVKEMIFSREWDSVINCIGILNQAAENNKALASYLNAFFPHSLAAITDKTDIQIIHMSTDCVFSGKRGGYTEFDSPDGETFYDKSKALGELNDKKNITLRNSIVGPDINPNGIGLLNWFLKQQGEINGYTKSLWTGQTTLQLAKTMEYVAKNKSTGLVNAVPDKPISKYNLLVLFNHYLRGDELVIHPVDGVNADKSLVRTNYDVNFVVPSYEKMIIDLSDWIFQHKELYPHYDIRG